ncbi:MAG: stage II sporulation protein E [Desulfotomaculum sp.]|nr:stage II sporulation protein E [Desulfotomaculum sp.]
MYNDFDIYPYYRSGKTARDSGGTGKKSLRQKNPIAQLSIPWSKIGQVFTGRWLLLYLTAFFLGRAVLLGELMPFGAALTAAAARVTKAKNIIVLFFAGVGMFSVTSGFSLAANVLTLLAVYLLLRFIPSLQQREWYIVPGAVLVTVLVIKCSIVAYSGGVLYSYISVLFEAVFACILTIAFLHALPPLWQQTVPGRVSGEAVFCILLLFGGIVAGTGEIGYQMVTLRGVISKFVVLLSALLGGAGLGASAGAVVGVIPGLSYVVTPVIVGAYSFSGLMAGLFRSFGRIGVCMGFFLGNILLSIYITHYGSILEVMLETALATIIFCLMPASWIEAVKRLLPAPRGIKLTRPTVSQARIKEITAGRMRDWSNVFNELAHSFKQVSSTVEHSQEEQGLEQLFIQVGQKVCDGCALYRTCWEREFYRTYQQVLDLLAVIETYGKLSIDDLPEEMKKRCARLKEMVITVSCLYDTFKLNNYWQNKLLNSRQLVSEQLQGVSEVLKNMCNQIEKDVEFTGELEESIIKRMKREGILVEDVFTFYHNDGGLEVGITRQACGGEMECHNKVAPVVSAATGHKMMPANSGCMLEQKQEECTFVLYSSLNYMLSVGSAGLGRGGSGVSGDALKTMQLRNGKYALVISDGMGAGHKALQESQATINLLEKLLATGFEKDMAVKTVNSILVLRSPNESFATIDLAVVDLYNGRTDFIKTCAAPTFLIRKDKVSIIKDNSLPVGIIENIEVTAQTRNLEEGDILVMVTDGVLDAYQGTADKEEWFKGILQDLAALRPQEIAEVILQIIETTVGGKEKISDDMTVLVAKLESSQL